MRSNGTTNPRLAPRPCERCGAVFSPVRAHTPGRFCSLGCYHADRRRPPEMDAADVARFWSKVDRSGGPEACWDWQGALSEGYGAFGFGGRREHGGTHTRAHRVVFLLTNGRWPEPDALHDCDNRRCVNPAHIYEGTSADNGRDRATRGRAKGGSMPGEAHPVAKLTWAQVRSLRARYAAGGVTQAVLARDFSVSDALVSHIVTGKVWRE